MFYFARSHTLSKPETHFPISPVPVFLFLLFHRSSLTSNVVEARRARNKDASIRKDYLLLAQPVASPLVVYRHAG